MMDDYIPANEAADLLHVSRATVVRLAGQGKLVGEKRFGVWFVTRASVSDRLALMAKKASPKVSDAALADSQAHRPQVRRASQSPDDAEAARDRLAAQIATAETAWYIPLGKTPDKGWVIERQR